MTKSDISAIRAVNPITLDASPTSDQSNATGAGQNLQFPAFTKSGEIEFDGNSATLKRDCRLIIVASILTNTGASYLTLNKNGAALKGLVSAGSGQSLGSAIIDCVAGDVLSFTQSSEGESVVDGRALFTNISISEL